MKKWILWALGLGGVFSANAQYTFQKGFVYEEAREMILLNSLQKADSTLSELRAYRQVKCIDHVGLDNNAKIWVRDHDKTMVLVIHGTTTDPKSNLANFFCSMMPAIGTLKWGDKRELNYQLASDEKAGVHGGFLLGYAFIKDAVENIIDSLYQAGYHQMYITGHSQGAAISYLMTADYRYATEQYPQLKIKSFAVAPPKIGNMYFSYDYDYSNRGGWAYSIINPADVVPEMPFTTQRLDIDMLKPNPFLDGPINDLPFLKRVIIKYPIRKMKKGADKSEKRYRTYLGKLAGKFVHKTLDPIEMPQPIKSSYFTRPGIPITLKADQTYLDFYKAQEEPNHHLFASYVFLLEKDYKD